MRAFDMGRRAVQQRFSSRTKNAGVREFFLGDTAALGKALGRGEYLNLVKKTLGADPAGVAMQVAGGLALPWLFRKPEDSVEETLGRALGNTAGGLLTWPTGFAGQMAGSMVGDALGKGVGRGVHALRAAREDEKIEEE